MHSLLILWFAAALVANLPAAFSRPRPDSGSGIEADQPQKRQSGCGNVWNNELKSPGYPHYYPNNMDCVYWVPIPAGSAMSIYFNQFTLEYDASCRWDYLKITNEKDDAFGVYCGIKSGITVLVTGQNAKLTFHSDGSVGSSGFRLIFTPVPVGSNGTQSPPTYPPMSTNPPTPTYPPMTTNPPWYTTAPPNGCGYVSHDYLPSPGYPNYYPNNMDCVYRVHISHGKALRIFFDFFEVDDCGYDYLRITNERNHTFGEYCGRRSGNVVYVTGHYAVITFHSDSSVRDNGYKLFFSQVQGNGTQAPPTTYPTNPPWYTTAPPYGCGYVHYNQLTSPGYPNFYPNNMDCVYWVHISHGKTLRIYFEFFEVDDCGWDYLRITNERNHTFGEYCGRRSGNVVYVTGRYAVITFHSDSSVRDNGYKLFFSHVQSVNVSTSAPYTTYPPYSTAFPSVRPSPNVDTKSKLKYYIHVLRALLDQLEYVVDNELGGNGNVSVREYKAQVKRALTDVHDAMQAEGRQKRDIKSVEMIDQLEKKADDLMKRLETKEAQYKRRALKKKLDKRAPRKTY